MGGTSPAGAFGSSSSLSSVGAFGLSCSSSLSFALRRSRLLSRPPFERLPFSSLSESSSAFASSPSLPRPRLSSSSSDPLSRLRRDLDEDSSLSLSFSFRRDLDVSSLSLSLSLSLSFSLSLSRSLSLRGLFSLLSLRLERLLSRPPPSSLPDLLVMGLVLNTRARYRPYPLRGSCSSSRLLRLLRLNFCIQNAVRLTKKVQTGWLQPCMLHCSYVTTRSANNWKCTVPVATSRDGEGPAGGSVAVAHLPLMPRAFWLNL